MREKAENGLLPSSQTSRGLAVAVMIFKTSQKANARENQWFRKGIINGVGDR